MIQSGITKADTIIHGAARGADTLAGIIAASIGCKVIAVPAEWDVYGKKAGILRNQKMLEMHPDLVLAFHDDIDNSKGTKDMVNRASRAGVECCVFKSR